MMDADSFIIKKAELETVCGTGSAIPAHKLPEYAFAGRSNVGKSSLINALVKRKSLARTSATPGKTRTINFYNVDDAFYLVDLPGYGYTKASESARAEWGTMVERYLEKTKVLSGMFLLVDIRHKPTADDILMYKWIVSRGINPVVIAAKADKLGKNDKPKSVRMIRDTLGLPEETGVIMFSAAAKTGLSDIYARMGLIFP